MVSGLWGDIRKRWQQGAGEFGLDWNENSQRHKKEVVLTKWRQNFRSISHQTPQATAPIMKLPIMDPIMKDPMMKLPIMDPMMKVPMIKGSNDEASQLSFPVIFLFYFKTSENW